MGLDDLRDIGSFGFLEWTDSGYGPPTAQHEMQSNAAIVHFNGHVAQKGVSRLDSPAVGRRLELLPGSELLLPLDGPLARQRPAGISLLSSPLGGGGGGKPHPPCLKEEACVVPWERLRPAGRARLAPAPIASTSALYAPLGAPLFSAQEITPRALEREGRKNGALFDPRFESSVINVERKLRTLRLLPNEVWEAALWKAQFAFQTGRLISKLGYLTESDRLAPLEVVRDLRSFPGTQ